MNNLVEGKYGHGAKVESRLRIKLRRSLRKKHSTLGGAGIPFDWQKGYDCETVLQRKLRIKNQYQSSSCGGQAASRWLEIARNLGEQSAKSIYAPIAYPNGQGSAVKDIENYICASGANDESEVPSYLADGTTNETWMTEESWKTPAVLTSSMKKAGWRAVSVAIDKESIAQAMRDTGSVIMLVEGQNGNPRSWTSPRPQPPVKTNPSPLWRHYMAGKGTIQSNALAFYQSWGEEVGDKGIQYFDDEYVNSRHILDAFTFVPCDRMKEITIIKKLLDLYRQLLASLTN